MRNAWIALILASGCASMFHFKDDLRALTANASCCPDFQITELHSWAFRVQSCGTISYWRCSSGDDGECCWPVPTEHDATRTIGRTPSAEARAVCRDTL